MKRLYLLLLLALSAAGYLCAQDSATARAISAARSFYSKSMGAASTLYTGNAYERYWQGVRGHPFYLSDQFADGTVHYNGSYYEKVPLLYDMARDALVSQDFSGKNYMVLLPEKVRNFTVGTHSFIRLVFDSSTVGAGSLLTGYYERLYNGNIRVLVKRKSVVLRLLKTEEGDGKAGGADAKFAEYDDYYIEKDGVYHAIDSEGDILAVCKDRKTEMRKFLNRREINFKKDRANAIVQAVAYYEQLKS